MQTYRGGDNTGKEPVTFGFVNTKKADEIIERYIRKGEVIDGIIPAEYENHRKQIARKEQMAKKQIRIALRNCGVIDPERIEEYIERDGYQALGKVLTELSPEATIEIIKKSGLRGRGGGGSLPDLNGRSHARSKPTRNT